MLTRSAFHSSTEPPATANGDGEQGGSHDAAEGRKGDRQADRRPPFRRRPAPSGAQGRREAGRRHEASGRAARTKTLVAPARLPAESVQPAQTAATRAGVLIAAPCGRESSIRTGRRPQCGRKPGASRARGRGRGEDRPGSPRSTRTSCRACASGDARRRTPEAFGRSASPPCGAGRSSAAGEFLALAEPFDSERDQIG